MPKPGDLQEKLHILFDRLPAKRVKYPYKTLTVFPFLAAYKNFNAANIYVFITFWLY